MPNKYNTNGLMEQADDIISSGSGGWGEWHEEELTELFKDVNQKRRKKFVKAYYEGNRTADGVTEEELDFMCNMLNVMITITFTPRKKRNK